MQTTLVRYLAAATLARGADAGSAVGFVLLAATASGVERPSLVAAILVACLTAPHLLGPALGRQLDRTRDSRRLIAVVFAVYGLLVAAATVGLGRIPLWAVAVLAASAGACGPLLTGGLSSRLGALVPSDERTQRRAQGLDSLSYGIGGTAGPAAVASLTALTGARTALILLSAAAIVAAVLVRTLPDTSGDSAPPEDALPLREAMRLIVATGSLRRVMLATIATAFPSGAIAIVSVALGHQLHVSVEAAGLLTAAFGLGNLAGSLLVTARPMPGEPENLVALTAAALGGGFVLCALAPSYALAFAAFAVLGGLNALSFTATLTSRAHYSPSGARAQIFVSMAAFKVGASSAGAAVAGAASGLGPRVSLLAGGVIIVATVTATVVDRRFSGDRGRCGWLARRLHR